MANSLSNVFNNLSEGILKIKYKCEHDDKKCGIWEWYMKYVTLFNFKEDLIEYKYICCNKNYQQKFDEKSKERFLNTYKSSNYSNYKIILLLQKNVYPC